MSACMHVCRLYKNITNDSKFNVWFMMKQMTSSTQSLGNYNMPMHVVIACRGCNGGLCRRTYRGAWMGDGDASLPTRFIFVHFYHICKNLSIFSVFHCHFFLVMHHRPRTSQWNYVGLFAPYLMIPKAFILLTISKAMSIYQMKQAYCLVSSTTIFCSRRLRC